MRKFFILLSLILCSNCIAYAQQSVSGKVIDSDTKKPMTFTNVAAYSLPDSTFVKGTVTSKTGEFVLDAIPANAFIKISFVGYKTKILPVKQCTNSSIIYLSPESKMLKNVTVTAKMFSYKATGVMANIQNTALSKLGSAIDVLKQMPFVRGMGESIQVFGKGTPIYYVNNRRLRNNDELLRINSADIKSVEVITNPGSEYDATVNAVIRITTIRPQGEGLSGSMWLRETVSHKFSDLQNADFNYRKKNLDIFASMQCSNNKGSIFRDGVSRYNNYAIYGNADIRSHTMSYTPTIGFNYTWKKKHSIGVRYDFYYTPMDTTFSANGNYTTYKNGVNNYNVNEKAKYANKGNDHEVNAYYNYAISNKSYLQCDMDYLYLISNTGQYTINHYMDNTYQNLNYSYDSKDKIYAAKVYYVAPLLKGSIKLGSEYSNTQKDANSNAVGTISTIIKPSTNTLKQNLTAAFVEYSYQINKFSVNAGVRFENIQYKYYQNGVKDNESSKTYSGFYPSVSIGYGGQDLYTSLAYRRTTIRPGYGSLSSFITYDGPYNYVTGNPLLKESRINSLTYTLVWKDFQVMGIYTHTNKPVLTISDMYNGSDSIVFNQPQNIKEYQMLALTASYSPRIGIWNPKFETSVNKPFLKYNGVNYNRPIYSFILNNGFNLPHNFIINCNMNYTTKGNSMFYYSCANNFNMDLYFVKSFLKNKWRLNLTIGDVLNTYRNKISSVTNNIYQYVQSNMPCRYLRLSVTYRFNQTKNKYKGQSAAEDEKSRIK